MNMHPTCAQASRLHLNLDRSHSSIQVCHGISILCFGEFPIGMRIQKSFKHQTNTVLLYNVFFTVQISLGLEL